MYLRGRRLLFAELVQVVLQSHILAPATLNLAVDLSLGFLLFSISNLGHGLPVEYCFYPEKVGIRDM